jgi:general secretion pathway protein M
MTQATADRGRCRQALVVLATLLIAAALLLGWAWLAKRAEYAEALQENRAALARYGQALARRPALEAALRDPDALKRLRDLFLVGDTAALAGAELQAQLRGLIEQAGGRLESSQILKTTEEADAVPRLVVQVRMRADARAMLEVLHRLESGRPLLHVGALSISAPRRGGDAEYAVLFELTGFLFPQGSAA